MTDSNDTSLTNKKEINIKNSDVIGLIEKKIIYFRDVIQKTILHVQKNKMLDIIGINDVNLCIDRLTELNKKIKEIIENKITNQNNETLINNLQIINNDLSSILRNYGTMFLEDLLIICFGNNNKITSNDLENSKFELLKKYFHPTSYKVINKKEVNKNKKSSNESNDLEYKSENLECSDIVTNVKQFYLKVNGIKVYIHNTAVNKCLLIYGVIDDVVMDILNNHFIINKNIQLKENLPQCGDFQGNTFTNYVSCLILKDYLINSHLEIYNKFAGYLTQIKYIKQKTIYQKVKEFISDDMYLKRITLIYLLINVDNCENHYLAYLLYDMLSNEVNGTIDTQEQTILFDSFPLIIKQHFKNAMKKTIQYTNELSNFELNKIPLEQQICLLKVNECVKEKAMMKLKEVKSKSEDSGSKARQYLDGLLKIPFNIYKREPILNVMQSIINTFREIYSKYHINKYVPTIVLKEKYTTVEICKFINQISEWSSNISSSEKYSDEYIYNLKKKITNVDKNNLILNINKINDIIESNNNFNVDKIICLSKKKEELKIIINKLIDECVKNNKNLLHNIDKTFCDLKNNKINYQVLNKELKTLNENIYTIVDYISEIKFTLDSAVYGHEKAKSQIERIIGQWINGEQDGYCFGFEGPPGVGKTSLAKRGLSNCLKDENGNSRPFAMIQIGGDSNGSSLHGHNYTYVGSTWGSIVQILIDKKCMNPIIFIDEIDKISKTEHGKEIIGILTHLLDPTQNDCFQDKYFSGIDLDLSKALFILSYNDPDEIDKILLDRVHRIKFSNLSLEDKLIIVKNHILPEVFKKMGLEKVISFSDEIIKFIIEEYTCESGVRKLKEILFEIVGEINIDILKNNDDKYEIFPIIISMDDITNKYFKDKHIIKTKKIHNESKIGIINGLWANAIGKGGIIPIQASYFPSDKFLDLKLTGMQGDVMKESMNVALTLSWKLTSEERKKELQSKNNDFINGVHIHCPEGAVPKDGPSAGTAITTTIYSLLNNKKIKNDIAITGEISLDGMITEIGGLDLKFLGGIKAGVKHFLFPEENRKDYESFMIKYQNSELIKDIQFTPVNYIDDVFDLIFEN
jgi:ATP-dependent Lon protease